MDMADAEVDFASLPPVISQRIEDSLRSAQAAASTNSDDSASTVTTIDDDIVEVPVPPKPPCPLVTLDGVEMSLARWPV